MSVSWRFRRLASSAAADLVVWAVWSLAAAAAVLLPLYTGASLLLVRGCHPSLDLSLARDTLQSLDLASLLQPPPPSTNLTSEAGGDLVTSVLAPLSSLQLRLPRPGTNETLLVTAPVLPRHLLTAAAQLATQLASPLLDMYQASDVSALCSVNNLTAPGVLSLGLAVCSSALAATLGPAPAARLDTWTRGLGPDTEAGLVNAAAAGNISAALAHLPQLFPAAGLTEDHVSSLQALVAPFSTSELLNLLEAFRNADFTDADLAVLEEVSKTAVDYLGDAEKVLMKIDVNNLPAIVAKLDELGIELTDFITNPGIFFDFLDDPVKLGVLTDLQELLPKFKPADIEAFLQLQEVVEAAQQRYGEPGQPSVMSKLFEIPMDVLLSALPKLKLDDSAAAAFDTFKLLMEDGDFEFLSSTVSSLLGPDQQRQLIGGCTDQNIRIVCNDQEHDVCPTGHLFLGLASLAPLLLPGLMYSLATFLHYQGDIMQCGLGKPFNIPSSKLDRISAWIILLPLYMLFMIPWTLLLIVYRQVVVCVSLAKEVSGGPRVEADCDSINNASSFGLLYGGGQGVLHLGLQIVVVALLLGAGDVVFGLEPEFVRSTAAVSVASVLLSLTILAVSYISTQEAGRLQRDLATPPSSWTYLATSLAWLLGSTLVSTVSTLLLCLLLYVDSVHFTAATWLLLPVCVLALLPALQCLLYCALVAETCEHRLAWGALAAVTPCRFLTPDRRPAARFLAASQLLWFLGHTAAWLAYCVYVLVSEQGSDVVFRVWLPVVMPLLLVAPLLASLHWSLSLAPVYAARHAHPDMRDQDRRLFSFPPDWKTISGSSVAADQLAMAGYFYSCRRLTTCETTCYGCGRQVADWTGVKTVKQCGDTCPLHADTKQEEAGRGEGASHVSCFAEFLFLSTTLMFRLASLCLLLWVFMAQWTAVAGQLWTLAIIPPLYLLLLLLLNTSTYFLCLGNTASASWLWALASVLCPRPAKLSSVPLSAARQLLVTNVSSNTLVHAFLWAAMTAACSTCSLSPVSLPSLTAAWPALVVLSAVSILAALPYYQLTVRPQARPGPHAATSHTNAAFMVSTAL